MPLCPGCGNYSGEVGDTCPKAYGLWNKGLS